MFNNTPKRINKILIICFKIKAKALIIKIYSRNLFNKYINNLITKRIADFNKVLIHK